MRYKQIGVFLCVFFMSLIATASDINKDLFNAIGAGDEKKVEALLANGADANTKMAGIYALMWAIRKKNQPIVEILLEKGADVNLKDGDGNSALIHAAFFDFEDAVKTLLGKGANVNEANKEGVNALMMAAKRGSFSIIKVLLERGADINAKARPNNKIGLLHSRMNSTLISVSSSGAIMSTSIDWNQVDISNSRPDGGYQGYYASYYIGGDSTALHMAAATGQAQAVRALLENGANVDSKAKDNATPLALAFMYLFLERRTSSSYRETIQLLLDKGADPNTRVDDDRPWEKEYTALHLASKYGRDDLVKPLLSKGADINAKSKDWWTPLMTAVFWGKVGPVEELIAGGADIAFRNKKGQNALDMARKYKGKGKDDYSGPIMVKLLSEASTKQ